MNKFITMIVSVVVVIVLISAILIPVVDQAHDTFTIRETVVFNNQGDEVTLGSQDEEYTVDWDSALPGTIKVNGNTPTVYFVAGEDGTVSPTQKDVVEGLTYGELPLPTRTGYTFDGWYDSTEYTTEITDTTVVVGTEDKILYAKWIGNTYTVTFDADGGTVSPATKQVTFGQAYGELPVPTYTGHIFGGWFDENDNPIVAQSEVSIADDHTLTAVWTLEQYLVSFTTDGNGTVDVAEVLVDYGTSYTISNNTITIDGTTVTASPSIGYVWDYWEPSTAGTVTSAMTFIAHFNNPPVTLSFTTDGTTGATVSQASIVDVPRGSTYVVADNTVTVSHSGTTLGTVTASLVNGYYFTGWNEAQGVGTVSDAMTFTAEYELIEIAKVRGGGSFLNSYNRGYDTFFITTDGKLFGTGANYKGELGQGNDTQYKSPVQIGANLGEIADCCCTTSGSMYVLTANGDVYSCGYANYGILGTHGGTSTGTQYALTKIATDISQQPMPAISKIYNNPSNGFFISTSGDLYSVGKGSTGTLGNGATSDIDAPQLISSGLGTVIDVKYQTVGFDGNYSSVFFITSNNTLYGMGKNTYGELGQGDNTQYNSPVKISDNVSNFATDGISLLYVVNGELFVTGNNESGQLGTGNTTNINAPTQVGSDLGTIEKVFMGEVLNNHSSIASSYFTTSDGKLYGMGSSQNTLLNGSTPVESTITNVVDIQSGYRTFLALRNDGTVYGYAQQQGSPTGPIVELSSGRGTITDICTFEREAYMLSSDGKLYGFGANDNGALGTGGTNSWIAYNNAVIITAPGSINITPILSPQINPLSPIHLNPLHPFTPIPIQPMSIDYTAITGFSQWQLGGEDWMLATVTTGVDEYALALYYAGLTEPLVWDEDVHMVFDSGTLTVENGGQTYTMTYSSIYYRSSGGNYRLLNGSATVLDDTPILAYGVPTDDSGALAKGTVGNLTAVSIADGQITLDGATATYSDVEGFDTANTLTSVSFQYDDNGTSPAIAVIVPSSVSVTHLTENKMLTTVLDVIPVILIIGTLMVLVSALFMGRRY